MTEVENQRRVIVKSLALIFCAVLFALSFPAEAQQPKVYRVGLIYPGDPFNAVVEGLRDGLKELGTLPLLC